MKVAKAAAATGAVVYIAVVEVRQLNAVNYYVAMFEASSTTVTNRAMQPVDVFGAALLTGGESKGCFGRSAGHVELIRVAGQEWHDSACR